MTPVTILRRAFGETAEGEAVDLITLERADGFGVDIATWGGTITALRAPDRHGHPGNVVLGFDALDGYLGPHPYFGAIIGRFGNRIARGRFSLDGREYSLACNDGPNHLHGGGRGFDRRVWAAETRVDATGASVVLRRASPDGEEGYPGNLDCVVVYTLTESGELRIESEARTDAPTVVNLTHHSYFNLGGDDSWDILGHVLRLDADAYLPVDEGLIPTGERRSVSGTPFDFRRPLSIGARMGARDEQLRRGKGYDHNFALNGWTEGEPRLRPVARLFEPISGRAMEVLTTEPGLQLYTGGALDGSCVGRGARAYGSWAALCLETQTFPDAPNHPDFPSARLDPGDMRRSTTIYRFSAGA